MSVKSYELVKCQDCGREHPTATNEITDGWMCVNGDWFCPTCLRLASCEKAILDLQHLLLRAGVKLAGKK